MADPKPARPAKSRPRSWSPHFWQGCDLFAWLRLLHRNRYAVGPGQWYVALIATWVSAVNTMFRYHQEKLYGRYVRQTRIKHPPLFILGHWRSGTTLLHELLIRDARHAYPNTYQVMSPNHFLATEADVTTGLWFLAPERRPMDNMPAGWGRPQEDEFALCMLGLPSPYLTIAFPNRPPAFGEYLTFEGVSDEDRERWKKGFYRYLQALTFKDPRRLVLKSPPHTGRIPVLRELFPDARFVHIVRNPYVIFPSTVNLWKSLYRNHGLQSPKFEGLEEYVFETFLRMDRKLRADRGSVPANRFHELKYEDLIRDPVGEMRRLYAAVELGDFEPARPRVEEYLRQSAGYETNRYELTPELREKIRRRWGEVIDRHGYAPP